MIQIRCTKQEKLDIVNALAASHICVFRMQSHDFNSCRECCEANIEWIITDEKKAPEPEEEVVIFTEEQIVEAHAEAFSEMVNKNPILECLLPLYTRFTRILVEILFDKKEEK